LQGAEIILHRVQHARISALALDLNELLHARGRLREPLLSWSASAKGRRGGRRRADRPRPPASSIRRGQVLREGGDARDELIVTRIDFEQMGPLRSAGTSSGDGSRSTTATC